MANLTKNFAPEFSASESYDVGDRFFYNRKLYQVTKAFTGTLVDDNVQEIFLSDLLKGGLNSNLGGLQIAPCLIQGVCWTSDVTSTYRTTACWSKDGGFVGSTIEDLGTYSSNSFTASTDCLFINNYSSSGSISQLTSGQSVSFGNPAYGYVQSYAVIPSDFPNCFISGDGFNGSAILEYSNVFYDSTTKSLKSSLPSLGTVSDGIFTANCKCRVISALNGNVTVVILNSGESYNYRLPAWGSGSILVYPME